MNEYRFCYQLDGEEQPRFETKTWKLGPHAAHSLMWRMLMRRDYADRVLWLEM